MDRPTRQKINKEMQALNDTLDKMALIDIYRAFHPKADYIFFSSTHCTFSRIDHMLGHKVSPDKFEIKTVSSIFSHNGMRLEINYKNKNSKKHKHVVPKYDTNQPLNHWRNKRIPPSDKRKWKHNGSKFMGCSKNSSKREVYNNTVLPEETRKNLQ